MTANGCPLCGAPHHSCGQPFVGTPIDIPRTEIVVKGEVQRYNVTVNGTKTVLKLTAKDAERYADASLVDGAAATANDVADAADEKVAKPANKARGAQNKGRTSGTAGNR